MTPQWAIDAILPKLAVHKGLVLEPACGTGNIVKALRAAEVSPEMIVAKDISETRIEECQRRNPNVYCAVKDFREDKSYYDLTITNPPFALAQEFAEHCVRYHASKGGQVALLLRLAFLEGVKRATFHQERPSDVYVLRRRPKFREDCASGDRWAYAWFVWGASEGGHWAIL